MRIRRGIADLQLASISLRHLYVNGWLFWKRLLAIWQDLNPALLNEERLIIPRKDSLYRLCLFGSPGKTRTCNLAVNSRSLYH